MKSIVALYFTLLIINFSFSQNKIKVYPWSIAKNLSPDSVFAISFENKKLDSLPNEIINYIHLKELYLSKNKLSSLPDSIVFLTELRILDLGKNKFTIFPPEITKFKDLKKLNLNRNDLTELPVDIGNLLNLEYLDLWETPIEIFPEEITELKKLKVLDVRGVMHGPKFQQRWKERLAWVKIEFDAPCNCLEP